MTWVVIAAVLCTFSGAWRLVPFTGIAEALVFNRRSRPIVRLVYGRSDRFRHWYVVHATRRLTRAFARTDRVLGQALLPAVEAATASIAEYGRLIA